MSDDEKKDDYEPEVSKRTRKTKAPVATITNRSTRRARRKDSEEECILPENIPRNQFTETECKQCFESQTTKLVIQIPLSQFVGEEFQSEVVTRVENIPLQIQIKFEKDSISCGLRLPKEVILDIEKVGINLHGKYSWLGETSIASKHIKAVRKVVSKQDWEWTSWVSIGPVHSDVFVSLTLRKEEDICNDYVGLINQGNTCYMNSYLQMIFHLPEFRKLIFSSITNDPERFPATLQMLFYRMLKEEKAVSPQELIRSFGWSKKDAQVQQDVQEFSCLFFDILERKVEVGGDKQRDVGGLFCGQQTHYIQCCDVENQERFFDLFLPLMPTLALSLDVYIEEQRLEDDNRYHTDHYGLQQAKKGLRISKLPPVLMLQLKRFQYNYHTEANEKMMGECKYPEQMDFGKWTTDPETPRPYQLYAVLVHEGSFASSGHYYVYIRQKKQWFKFNDEQVEKVTREKALHFNYGGESDSLEFIAKQMKMNFKKHQIKSTAYMLVYISKDMYNEFFNDIIDLEQVPQWLIDRTRERREMDEEKKARKQMICDLPVLRWHNQFSGQQYSGMGLVTREMILNTEEHISSLPKNSKVEEWLKEPEQVKEESGSEEESTDVYTYLYWTSQEREVLLNVNCRGGQSIRDLFADIMDPVIILAPVLINKEEYLVVLKEYNQNEESESWYSGLTKIKKDTQMRQLYKHIRGTYLPGSNHRYYIEDKKLGLIEIKAKSAELLPIATPTRNQLLVVVIQKLAEGEKGGRLQEWYKQEMDSLKIAVYNEEDKQVGWEREINKHTTVAGIRTIIFSEMVTDKSLYQSHSNIVIKYRPKKTSKLLAETKDTDTLKDLVKVEKAIYFCHSALDTKQRLTRKEIVFFYRLPNSLYLGDLQKIVVDRKSESSIVDLIHASKVIKQALPLKIGFALRMFLLAKDRTYINDVVDENGFVHKKGELFVVLEREKNAALVVEQYEKAEGEEERIDVLLHHVAKTGEKIGLPRWEYAIPSSLLSALKYHLLEKIERDEVEFEGRVHQFNPAKVRLLIYAKDWGRAEEMPQPSELMNGEGSEGDETVESRFGSPRWLRVGILHSGISKIVKALKLDVQ